MILHQKENIKGDVKTMEPNEGRYRVIVENKGAGVCAKR
jgi:hypothetical protein